MKFRKLPPLNALAAFESIARHRSFTKASKELFLTPSAISQRIRQLEKHLDTQLLVRTRRSVQLTGEGARYVEEVREALAKLAKASEGVSDKQVMRLRIGVVPAFASNWLIYRLRSFQRQFPDIDLDIEGAIGMAKVAAGEVDVAIRWGKGPWAGLEQFKLFADELLAVCSTDYREGLGRLDGPVDLRRAVLLRNAIQPWKPWFAKAGLGWPEPARGPTFNDSTLALQAAADGLGVALGRRMLVQHLLEEGSLVQLFDTAAPIEEAFFVVYEKDALERPEVAAFVDWIRSVAAKERAATHSLK